MTDLDAGPTSASSSPPLHPSLPPRVTVSPSPANDDLGRTPGGLYVHLQESPPNAPFHPHLFLACPGAKPAGDPAAAPAPAAQYSSDGDFVCQTCHVHLTIRAEAGKAQEQCSTGERPTHHYHRVEANSYACCACQRRITAVLSPPELPLRLIQDLASRRPSGSLDPPGGGGHPSMVSTLSLLAIYVSDYLQGTRRNLNTHNKAFLSRIGLYEDRLALCYYCSMVCSANLASQQADHRSHRLFPARRSVLRMSERQYTSGRHPAPFSHPQRAPCLHA